MFTVYEKNLHALEEKRLIDEKDLSRAEKDQVITLTNKCPEYKTKQELRNKHVHHTHFTFPEHLIINRQNKGELDNIINEPLFPGMKFVIGKDRDTITYMQHIIEMKPLGYQKALAALSKESKKTLIVSSTGSGKTAMYLYLLRYWMVIYPTKVLVCLVQTSNNLPVSYTHLTLPTNREV